MSNLKGPILNLQGCKSKSVHILIFLYSYILGLKMQLLIYSKDINNKIINNTLIITKCTRYV